MKKILSVLLVLVMALAVVPCTAFAQDDITCPVIYVPGVDSSPIYADKNDPDSRMSLVEVDVIKQSFSEVILPALVVYSADKDAQKLGNKISAAINEIYAPWFMNSDGTAKDNSGTILNYPQSVKNGGTYTFYYDWRGDVITAAKELRAYVEYICEKSGSETVALSTHSLGGAVAMAYLSLYNNDTKLMGIVFDTPVIDGVSYLGEMFSLKSVLSSEGLMSFFKGVLSVSDYEELAGSLLDIFSMAGLSDSFTCFVDEALKEISPIVFEKSIIPLFGSWPSIWAMVKSEDIESAMNSVFDGTLKDQDTAALQEKIIAYNTLRADSDETLLSFDQNGRVAVISRYGYSSLPVTQNWNSISDLVVDTSSSSLGATTATSGACFSEEYLEGKDMKYISPDKTVDSSTCLFPEKTWFIKGVTHSETEITRKFHNDLLFGEAESTCDSFTLDRFSALDRDSMSVVKDNSVFEDESKDSALTKLFKFIKALLNKVVELFKSFFK